MTPYFYNFELERVLDGDTVDGTIDLGFRLFYKTRLRLKDVHAPETYRPKSEEEREAGNFCTAFLEGYLEGAKLTLHSRKLDIYNRSVGDLYAGEKSVNDAMRKFITDNGFEKEKYR